MTVGFFSPMPPARTGVADYAAALAAELRTRVDVRPRDARAGVCLYHLGNNGLHRTIYEQALARPGLAVLHDAVLHHFFLGSLGEVEYVREFVYNYGAWSEDLARRLWRRRKHSAIESIYFAYPMLKRIAETSLGVVVHNPAAAAMVRAHAPAARVYEIPHLTFATPVVEEWRTARLRARLGIPQAAFLFGVFGYLRPSKRIAAVLRAFDRVRGGCHAALLVAGRFVSADLERALEPLARAPGVVRVGHLEGADFPLHAALADACINLRYPAAGETSGIAIRLMQLGRPVILTAGEEIARIPAAACVRVDRGETEEDTLAAAMLWLARHPSEARGIGRRAAAYVSDVHAPARAADLYTAALADCYHLQHP